MIAAGEGTPIAHTPAGDIERSVHLAILRFRHSPQGSGVSRTGHIRPGGLLRIEYDPARLPPAAESQQTTEEIICHMQFQPHGERNSGNVLDPSGVVAHPGSARQVPFEVSVPNGATQVELWFESRGATGTSGWDSRYGQNYSFAVIGEGLPVPEPSVAIRSEALADPAAIHVVEDAATKQQTRIGSGGRSLHAGLTIRAIVADAKAATDVWADIHVFDAADELIHAGSVALQRPDAATSGSPFVWADDIYQGSGGGSGIGMWSRPDAHTIQYRLYCHISRSPSVAQVFTDGILHELELPADEEVGAQHS